MWLVFVGLYNIYSNISDQMSGVEKWMATNQETVAYCRLFDTVIQLHERELLCVKIWPVLKIWRLVSLKIWIKLELMLLILN